LLIHVQLFFSNVKLVVVLIVLQPPTDLSWGCNGRVLLAASQDGTVAVLRFTDDQFATAIPQAEVSSVLLVYCMHAHSALLMYWCKQAMLDVAAAEQRHMCRLSMYPNAALLRQDASEL
jgi:hypothetical protein